MSKNGSTSSSQGARLGKLTPHLTLNRSVDYSLLSAPTQEVNVSRVLLQKAESRRQLGLMVSANENVASSLMPLAAFGDRADT
jgi:hypothetical protein